MIESRLSQGGHVKRRRRECQNCHGRFTTHEEIDYAALDMAPPPGASRAEKFPAIPARSAEPTNGEQAKFLEDNPHIAEQFVRLVSTNGPEIGRNYVYSQMGYRSY